MGNTEKKKDEIIADAMKELYDSIERKEKGIPAEEIDAAVEEVAEEIKEEAVGEEIVIEDISEEVSEEKNSVESDSAKEEEIDEEDSSEEEESDEEREERGTFKKTFLKAIGIIFGILVLIYAGFAIFFNSHYTFNTTINGKDYALKSVEAVASDMEQQVQGYTLTLKESDGDSEEIKGDIISLEYVPTDELEQLMNAQNSLLWITSIWNEPALETKITVQYDDNKLADVIDNLACMDPDNQTKSENAVPEFKDTQFVIKEEVIGTQIDEEIFDKAVRSAIEAFEYTLNLSEKECYLPPKYLSTSEEVIEACEKMNSYLGAEITYDMHPDTVVVDASVISEWISVNKNMKVKFSEEKMREYLAEFAKKYDTWGKDRTFKAADGDTVTVSGGRYGWLINEKEEFKQLKKDIKKGEKVTREPVYYDYGKAVEHTETDWGDTYAEVDLTDQKMYFIKDGNVVLESHIVTGNPNKGNATPQGVYSLTYKTRNAVLRGERDENGEPEYETPVAYWMPFNYGIGFHDATWQSSFGGSRYRTHGSHGCVNMPKSKAAELYELIPDKCPVICHY